MPFVIQAVLLAKLDSSKGLTGIAGLHEGRWPLTNGGPANPPRIVRDEDLIVIGRAPEPHDAPAQTHHVAVPENAGFGRFMPARAIVLTREKRPEGRPPRLSVTLETREKKHWRLSTGSYEILPDQMSFVESGTTIALQMKIKTGWVDILAVTIDFDGPRLEETGHGISDAGIVGTDPIPVFVLQEQAAELLYQDMFSGAPREWKDWAMAIASIVTLHARPELFRTYPHLTVGAAQSRNRWVDAVTLALGRKDKDPEKFLAPSRFLRELNRRIEEALDGYTFDALFLPDAHLLQKPDKWFQDVSALLAEHRIVRDETFDTVARSFPQAEEMLAKKRQARGGRTAASPRPEGLR